MHTSLTASSPRERSETQPRKPSENTGLVEQIEGEPRLVIQVPNEPFRFLVQSESTAEKYLVDIQEAGWTGWCNCAHFLCRLAPKIAQGERGATVRCKHLRKAREFFLETVLPKLADAMGMSEPEVFETAKPATEYMKLRNEFLAKHRRCAVFPALFATECHHSRGKLGSLLTDSRFFIPVSRLGHNKIDANREWARGQYWNGIPLLCARGEWNTQP